MTSTVKPSEIAIRAHRLDEATHRFAQGQAVRLKNAYLATGSVYLITASLPPLGASPQYRIRNEAEQFERVASEGDLEAVFEPASREFG